MYFYFCKSLLPSTSRNSNNHIINFICPIFLKVVVVNSGMRVTLINPCCKNYWLNLSIYESRFPARRREGYYCWLGMAQAIINWLLLNYSQAPRFLTIQALLFLAQSQQSFITGPICHPLFPGHNQLSALYRLLLHQTFRSILITVLCISII